MSTPHCIATHKPRHNPSLSPSSPSTFFLPVSVSSDRKSAMTVAPLMFRSLIRLMAALLGHPVPAITTLLYYGEMLPANSVLERWVCQDFLDRDNYLFHFLINFLRCFW